MMGNLRPSILAIDGPGAAANSLEAYDFSEVRDVVREFDFTTHIRIPRQRSQDNIATAFTSLAAASLGALHAYWNRLLTLMASLNRPEI